MSAHVVHERVEGPVMTPTFRALLVFIVIGAAVTLWRFIYGLGSVSNLSDGYPWGVWIALDVVVGTALGCGGFAIALLAYIFNKGEYHPLVRPAVLTSLLGYGLAVLAVAVDLGRYWGLWKVPFMPWRWTKSPQLEVALCVAAYVMVVAVELSPALFEKLDKESGGTNAFAKKALKFLDKILIWVLALGILLPMMHQSSLGTMMTLTGPRLHPLWFTAWLPFLFLINCIIIGFAVIVLEASFSGLVFKRPRETEMLGKLAGVTMGLAGFWIVFRLAETAFAGELGLIGTPMGGLFLVELGLTGAGIAMLLPKERRFNATTQVRAAILLLLGGVFYRVDTFLVAFNPGSHFKYFPALPELFITFGIFALEAALYLWAVKTFPILSRPHTETAAATAN